MTALVIAGLLTLSAASARMEPAPPAGAQDQPANVAGVWALTVETGQGTGRPSVKLQQDGDKLTGTYSSEVFGEQAVTGSVKGAAVTFAFTASFEGNTFTVTYAGTVEKDSMKGKVTLGELGEGTFTGTRR
jgi:hypothetical protein